MTKKGPSCKMHPGLRVIIGIGLIITVSISCLQVVGDFLLLALLILLWVLFCQPTGQALKSAFLLATLLFAPLVLLAPWLAPDPMTSLALAMRGSTGVIISIATVAHLKISDTERALCFLPRSLRILILQIILQSSLLFHEVRMILQVLRLRGNSMRVLFGFPVIWLSRLLLRAEQIGSAMELRGME